MYKSLIMVASESSPVTSSPVNDQETVEWKIKTLRNAIGHDWAVLATAGLSSEQRKATRERLKINIKDLRQIVGQRPSASDLLIWRPSNLEARNLGIDAIKNALGS